MAGFQSLQKYDDSSDEETKEMPAPKQVARPTPVVQQPKKPAYQFGGDSSDDEPLSAVQDKLRPQTASVAMTQPIVKQVQPAAPQQKKAGFAPQQAKPAGFPSQPVRSSVLAPGK